MSPPEGPQPARIRSLTAVEGSTSLVRQTALTDLARTALLGVQQRPLLAKAARLVQRALDAERCGIYEYVPGGHDLLLRAAAFASGAHRRPSTIDVTAAQAGPYMDGTVRTAGVLTVPIRTSPPFGFLAARRDQGDFDDEDRHFAIQVADILAAALERLGGEEARRRAALHDPLTGLPNRALILDHLRLALARSRRRPCEVGVLFVDLDRFKAVNDTLGHHAGDAVLLATAERLRSALRPPDTVGRLGGDEFVVVCEDIVGSADCVAVAKRLAASLEVPVQAAGRDLRIRASIGVAVSGGADTDPAALLAEADGAMFWAKRTGSGVALFDERMRVGADEVEQLEAGSLATGHRFHLGGNSPDSRTIAGGRLVARLVGLLEELGDPDLDLRDPA